MAVCKFCSIWDIHEKVIIPTRSDLLELDFPECIKDVLYLMSLLLDFFFFLTVSGISLFSHYVSLLHFFLGCLGHKLLTSKNVLNFCLSWSANNHLMLWCLVGKANWLITKPEKSGISCQKKPPKQPLLMLPVSICQFSCKPWKV